MFADALRVAAPLALMLLCVGCDETPPLEADAGAPRDAGMRVDAGPPPVMPAGRCPGSEGCMMGNDGMLLAGAARVSIAPDLSMFETYTDENGDGKYDAGEPFVDDNGNGEYDGAWIAGFGNARAATGIHDPVWATAIALRNGDITMVFVSLDVVGWFVDENDRIREALSAAGTDLDYLIVSATHVHESADTIGIWGRTIGDTGLYPAYQAFVRAQAQAAVTMAIAALEPANIEHVEFRLRDADYDGDGSPDGDVLRWVGDNRDPNVIDDEVRVMRFVRAGTATAGMPGSGETLGTMVNFAAHPEYIGSRNTEISSDWPNWMREAMESGIAPDDLYAPEAEGIGGITLFINGALGVQIGPNGIHMRDRADTPVPDDGFEGAACMGTQLGSMILGALRGTLGTGTPTSLESGDLAYRAVRFHVLVENRRYHIAGQQMLFDRGLYLYDEDRPIQARTGNLPWVLTEVAVIDVGPITMLTSPGELDPAEFIGGYDAPCTYTPGGCDALIDEDDINPPDVTMAPTGPFLRARMMSRRSEASSAWLLGCTQDFLGYFIPDFDFELDPALAYIGEAPGDHYEETNSVGTQGWPRIRSVTEELLAGD